MTDPRVYRGEIWWVNFDPTVGAEVQKIRPAVIIQNDIANEHSPVTVVAALTTNVKAVRFAANVLIKAPEGGLRDDSVILTNQIRVIDQSRLHSKVGQLSDASMTKLNRGLALHLGIITP